MSIGQSLVAVGHPDDAFAGFAPLAALESGEAGGFAISARSTASIFSAFIRSQRCAHRRPGTNYDLAAGRTAIAHRRFGRIVRGGFVPARAVLTGLPTPGDRAVLGESRDGSQQGRP